MKKFLILLSCCLLPVLAGAQSTCETRVDAHQRATTKQRVAYCLTPDSVAADDTNAGLVFSGVSAHYPSDVQPVDRGGVRAKEGNFAPEQVVVSRTYVGTAQFPQVFEDDASEIVQVDNSAAASVRGSEKPAVTMVAAQTQSVTEVPAPVEHFMSDEVGQHNNALLQTGVVETKKGVLARQTKPARRWVAPAAQPQVFTPSDPYTYQPEDLATPSQPEIPVGTQSYAPAMQTPDQPQDVAAAPISEASLPDTQKGKDEILVGTSSYAPVTSN